MTTEQIVKDLGNSIKQFKYSMSASKQRAVFDEVCASIRYIESYPNSEQDPYDPTATYLDTLKEFIREVSPYVIPNKD